MKKIVNINLCLLICFLLSGCCINHDWQEAACETPKTCIECGETEGEARGHNWIEASCETAKHCEICNLSEGMGPGHQWVEADYEKPKTCTVCKLTEGEKLQSFVEKYRINTDIEMDKEYAYETMTSSNEENPEKIKGTIIFHNKEIVNEKEGYEAEEGFKWCIIEATARFDSAEYPIVREKGANASWRISDVNTGINIITEPAETIPALNDQGVYEETSIWNMNGREIPVTYRFVLDSEWKSEQNGRVLYVYFTSAVKIPEDYNDLILCLSNTQIFENRLEGEEINDSKFFGIIFNE